MNPRSADDTALLIRVAEGDPGAVREVLSRYSALVWSLASGLSKDPHEVEDVVQDIFVDVWRSAKRYDPKMASEATFIATIARRRVIDRRRRAGRRVDPEPLEEETRPARTTPDCARWSWTTRPRRRVRSWRSSRATDAVSSSSASSRD